MKKFILFSISAYLLLTSIVPTCAAYVLQKMEPSDILANSQQHLKDNFQGLTAGTADTTGTGLDTWQIGDGGDTNKDIKAGNDDSTKPFIRYIATQDTWAISNSAGAINYFTLATRDDGSPNRPDDASAVWTERNKVCFEGATANGFETCITITDPTADRSVTLGNTPAIDLGEELVKAWVQFNGTNGAIADSYNTASTVRASQGTYTWALVTSFANESYSVVCMTQGANSATTGRFMQIDADGTPADISAGTIKLECVDVANAVQDEEIVSCMAIGNI